MQVTCTHMLYAHIVYTQMTALNCACSSHRSSHRIYLPFKRVWQSMGLPGVVQFVSLLLEEAPEWRHTEYTKGRGRDHMEGMGTDHMEGEGQRPYGKEGQRPHGGRETTQTHHVKGM